MYVAVHAVYLSLLNRFEVGVELMFRSGELRYRLGGADQNSA